MVWFDPDLGFIDYYDWWIPPYYLGFYSGLYHRPYIEILPRPTQFSYIYLQSHLDSWRTSQLSWITICFYHLWRSANFMISVNLLYLSPWDITNRDKWSRYSTISFMHKINSRVLESQGLNNPQCSYLFWNWSSFKGNKFVDISFMSNSYFVAFSCPFLYISAQKLLGYLWKGYHWSDHISVE